MEATPKGNKDNKNAATPASMASTESRPYDEAVDKSKSSTKPKTIMLLAPTTRTTSPTRGRTLLTDEKEGGKPAIGQSNDPEEGRESFTPPVKDEREDDPSRIRKGGRKQLLWCVFGFSLVLGSGAGIFGYFYMQGKNVTETDTLPEGKLPEGFIRRTESPSESPTLSPTVTILPSSFPSFSAEPTQTFAPSDSPSERPTPSPTLSPSSSPTVSQEPSQSPSAAPTRDFLGVIEEFLSGSYNVNVARRVDGKRTNNALAIDWLVGEHKRQVIDVFDEKLAQRFALVAMDLALQGAKIATDAPRNAQQTIDHCKWKGIKCNSEGFVREVHWDHQQKGRNGSGRISSEAKLLVRSLKTLDLSNNELVGKIPESLYKLTNLNKLYLFKNQLEGTISSNIGNLDSITHFHLSHNKLSGKIPMRAQSDNDGIRPLEYFNVYSNNLTGTLPRNLRWRSCIYFDVGRNQLTGTLPNGIGETFVALRHLHLDHNEFRGTLPESYNTVGNGRLESFSIDHNKLTGTIPGKRDLYNKLVQYTLHSNQFESMDSDTCKSEVPKGEMVELRADCDVCTCNGFFDICDLQCFRG
mmetsp:Transcript_6101/g.15111  ORF Transcript_6101/g.15111 Transcript_6101/m.15111 type:complete len:581 (-) Transcript_6101:497-2239(-)